MLGRLLAPVIAWYNILINRLPLISTSPKHHEKTSLKLSYLSMLIILTMRAPNLDHPKETCLERRVLTRSSTPDDTVIRALLTRRRLMPMAVIGLHSCPGNLSISFQCNLCCVFFGVVDILAVVPEAGRHGLALDIYGSAPSSPSSY